MPEYSEEILDSNSISSTDKAGRPIPVTIPIALAPGIKVVYTTRLGGLSAGDYGNLNLGGKSGDEPEAVLSNRIALAEAVQARLSLVSQVHSGVAVDVDDSFIINTPFGFDVSGTHGETDTPHVIEADGQVTAQSGIALGMFAADCLPVLLRFWSADEEFPAQLQLLWDRNTCRYLRYETTFYLSGEILRRLRDA